MKTTFIGAVYKREQDYLKIKELVDKEIPEQKIAICYSNQFAQIAKKL